MFVVSDCFGIFVPRKRPCRVASPTWMRTVLFDIEGKKVRALREMFCDQLCFIISASVLSFFWKNIFSCRIQYYWRQGNVLPLFKIGSHFVVSMEVQAALWWWPVLQGSILLFLALVNDVCAGFFSEFILFADDLKILLSIPSG